jgi:hypothetical protein
MPHGRFALEAPRDNLIEGFGVIHYVHWVHGDSFRTADRERSARLEILNEAAQRSERRE